MENVKYIPGDLVKVKADNYIIPVESTIWKSIGSRLHIMGDREERYTELIDINSELPSISAMDNDVIPILITKKILKKNGWKQTKHVVDRHGYQYYLYENENNHLPELQYYPKDAWNKEDSFSIFWGDTEIRPDVHYLHELQHLLFGLGLDSSLKV